MADPEGNAFTFGTYPGTAPRRPGGQDPPEAARERSGPGGRPKWKTGRQPCPAPPAPRRPPIPASSHPLLFIDVDGPLNPFERPFPGPQGYTSHRMKPDTWLRAHPGRPPERVPPLTVRLDPAHGPKLLELPMEPVWATTWEDDANTWIGPHLGLPELPVVRWASPRAPDPAGLHWKTREVAAWAGERPFAWIDDEPGERDREWLDLHHPAHCLLLRIDASRGLGEEDFTLLREWAGNPRTA